MKKVFLLLGVLTLAPPLIFFASLFVLIGAWFAPMLIIGFLLGLTGLGFFSVPALIFLPLFRMKKRGVFSLPIPNPIAGYEPFEKVLRKYVNTLPIGSFESVCMGAKGSRTHLSIHFETPHGSWTKQTNGEDAHDAMNRMSGKLLVQPLSFAPSGEHYGMHFNDMRFPSHFERPEDHACGTSTHCSIKGSHHHHHIGFLSLAAT